MPLILEERIMMGQYRNYTIRKMLTGNIPIIDLTHEEDKHVELKHAWKLIKKKIYSIWNQRKDRIR
jgi:hypothetical protein